MKVFVSGGTGFVGKAVIEALLARDHSVHVLVNHRSVESQDTRVTSFPGGLFDAAAIDRAMQNCSAVVHLVGIIKEQPSKQITFDRIHYEGTKNVVDAEQRAGIARHIQMSALGASPVSPSMYHRTKFAAEEYVRSSDRDWTIFEPSLIHGPGGDFTQQEQGWARGRSMPFFFMPYFGVGMLGMGRQYKLQPIFVCDVARAVVEALENEKTVGEVFPVGGADQITWPEMHRIAAEIFAGTSRRSIAIPAWYAKAISHIVPPMLLPFTRDQVLMSQQDNVCDLSKFIDAFGWTPGPFGETLRSYAGHKAMRD